MLSLRCEPGDARSPTRATVRIASAPAPVAPALAAGPPSADRSSKPSAPAKPAYDARIVAASPDVARELVDWPRPTTTFVPQPPGAQPKSRPNGDGCSATRLMRTHGLLGEDPVQALVKVKAKRITVQIENLKRPRRLVLEGELERSPCERLLDNSARMKQVGRPRTGKDAVLITWLTSVGAGRTQLEGTLQVDGESRELRLWDLADDRLEVHRAERELLLREEGIAADVQALAPLPGGTVLTIALSAGLERSAFLAELEHEPPRVRATSDTGLSCRDNECEAMLAAFEVMPGVVLLLARLDDHPWSGKCTQQVDVELWTHTSQGLAGGGFLPPTFDCAGGLHYPSSSSSTSLYWADVDGTPPLELLSAHTDDGEPSLAVFGYDPDSGAYRQINDETPSAALERLSAQLEGATSFTQY